jgi:hypothetical protein
MMCHRAAPSPGLTHPPTSPSLPPSLPPLAPSLPPSLLSPPPSLPPSLPHSCTFTRSPTPAALSLRLPPSACL